MFEVIIKKISFCNKDLTNFDLFNWVILIIRRIIIIMKTIRKRSIIFLMSVVLALTGNLQFSNTVNASAKKIMKLEWFDVGAGDCMFIKFPNQKTVLIDAGIKSAGNVIVKKLQANKINSIDYCISTHPDLDHCGGLEEVFASMNVKNFYYPDDAEYDTQSAKRVMALSKSENGCELHNPSQGQKIEGGAGSFIEFVQSNSDFKSDNEDSLAVYIEFGDLHVLTCGDNEKGSGELIKKCNVDILQLPHHGSKYATSLELIKRFDPENVVISTDGKKYGHPNKEVFEVCKSYDSNIKVYRTDKIGDIKIIATNKSWKFGKNGLGLSKCIVDNTDIVKKNNETKTENINTSKNETNKATGKVYITKTGTKYHSSKSCPGLSNANQIYTIDENDVGNLEKCKKCW